MENNKDSAKSVAKDIGGIIATIVFFASFIPYFILIYFGIDGINYHWCHNSIRHWSPPYLHRITGSTRKGLYK